MPLPSTPEIEAARWESRLANGFAMAGSMLAILSGLSLRSAARYGFAWEYAAADLLTFVGMASVTLLLFGVALRFAWQVRRRTGVIVAAAWCVGVMGVTMAVLTAQAVLSIP
jgi:hypothetical protein